MSTFTVAWNASGVWLPPKRRWWWSRARWAFELRASLAEHNARLERSDKLL